MNIINVENVFDLIKHTRFVGIGTTAIVFLTKDNKVLKIYMNTHKKHNLFAYKKDMCNHLSKINNLNNLSFIGPEELIMCNGEVVGYTMPYIKGRLLKRINSDIKISELKEAIKILADNTKEISDLGFRLFDLHNKNIIISDNKFYVIDLDRGEFINFDSDKLFNVNMKSLNQEIISAMFLAEYYESLKFPNYEVEQLYNESIRSDYDKVYDLLDAMEDKVGINDPSIKQLRRSRVLTPSLTKIYPYY